MYSNGAAVEAKGHGGLVVVGGGHGFLVVGFGVVAGGFTCPLSFPGGTCPL